MMGLKLKEFFQNLSRFKNIEVIFNSLLINPFSAYLWGESNVYFWT
jgi:hypothetical protein